MTEKNTTKTSRELASHVLAEVTSFIGSDIGDPQSPHAEAAPKGAKHVVTVSWSWSPAHSRISEYRIAADRTQRQWDLYECVYDSDSAKRLSARVASGSANNKTAAKQAAIRLLMCAWQDEMDLWEFDPDGFEVDKAGILGEEDIDRIVNDLKWINSSSWLSDQSEESLDLLRAALPSPLDEQTIDTLDEVASCITTLGLTQDFLKLCRHYELESPSLLTLTYFLSRDAAIARERAAQTAAANVRRLRQSIDLLTSELDSQSSHAAGMTIPSKQQRAKEFLERYVGKHGELPRGKHEIHSFFKATIDFDELRQKHGLG